MKTFLFLLAPLLLLLGCAAAPSDSGKESVVFYPPPPQTPRLQFLLSINGEDDIAEPSSAFAEFVFGDVHSRKTIGKPYDIASSPGKLYILDRRYKKLLIIDLVARSFTALDDQRLGALAEPSGIWVSTDGTKYIADMKRKQVVVFDAANTFLRTYGYQDMFEKPVDVAVFENRIYVCDMNKNAIVVVDKDSGKQLATIGTLGQEDGQFYKPSHVNIDDQGNIFVNDAFNYKIQKFDMHGNFIKSFGFHGDTIGSFARPKGLDIDRDGHLYAVDSAFENVQIFDTETARLLLFFGGAGTNPGNMYLPAAIHIDYTNAGYFANYVDKDFRLQYVVYVGNMFGSNKLNVYGFGEWIGPSLTGSSGTVGE